MYHILLSGENLIVFLRIIFIVFFSRGKLVMHSREKFILKADILET